jgi:lactaldehyde dehydrogenase/glycolaldehyde dehydrogenase
LIVTGGHRRPGDQGYFYEPTAIADCGKDMEIIRREIFEPVLPVVTFSDLDEGIACANDSDYGLTSSVYTRDLNVALKVSREIRFGETYINATISRPCKATMPVGVRAESGARMVSTVLYEFTQSHVVYVQGD